MKNPRMHYVADETTGYTICHMNAPSDADNWISGPLTRYYRYITCKLCRLIIKEMKK